LGLASAVTRTPSCSQRVSWSWSQTTDQCGEKARPNVCPPPFIVVSVYRHACQLIKLCSENATIYRRQSVVFRQWHPVRIAGRIAADPIMERPSPHDSSAARNALHSVNAETFFITHRPPPCGLSASACLLQLQLYLQHYSDQPNCDTVCWL